MKKYYIIALCVLHFGNLYNVYPCDEDFLKAWKVSSEDCERCIKLEEKIEKEKGNIRDLFKAVDGSLIGPLNYTMSWDEINKKITDVFTQMRAGGRIVTQAEFDKIKDKYYVHDEYSPDFSLVWGAEYLRNAIAQNPSLHDYAVLDYVIVVHSLMISVRLHCIHNAPKVTVTGAPVKIYFKKRVSGKNVTDSSQILKTIGFDPIDNEGEVIYDAETNKRYIMNPRLEKFNLEKFNLKSDFIGMGEGCKELYIKKLIYNEYGFDTLTASIPLDLSHVPIASESVDMLAQALNSLRA